MTRCLVPAFTPVNQTLPHPIVYLLISNHLGRATALLHLPYCVLNALHDHGHYYKLVGSNYLAPVQYLELEGSVLRVRVKTSVFE
jgi:hypothetical protein